MKKLIISEKPSVAREFAKVLNINGTNNNGYIESSDYVVTWCVGHLVTMSYPDKYDEKLRFWNLYNIPFIPKEFKYEIIEGVKKQFDIVSSLLSREDIETIYVATDSGREGEYIYRLVDSLVGNKIKCKDKRRVWIDSQTKEAIEKGIKEAKSLKEYDNLASSAYLRAKEDYLIGINFSRILTVIYGGSLAKKINTDRASISIGRVMTCVLGMIVSREREIKNFKKEKYFKLQGSFGEKSDFLADFKITDKSKYFESPKLYSDTGFKKDEYAKECKQYILDNKDKAYIKEVTKKKLKENAPLLFNLAEAQNECTKRFKISPDETLNIIQTLYERKLVTYPRTDARVLSSAVAKEISKNLNGIFKNNTNEVITEILNKMKNEKYSTNLLKTKYVNDSKITDHYAIIPTGSGFENLKSLNSLEIKVFNMIVIRFLAIFFPEAVFNKINATIDVNNEIFTTSGKVCTIEGYLEVFKLEKEAIKKEKNNDEKSNEEESLDKNNIDTQSSVDILKKLKKGDKINLIDININTSETTPPTRYNSGSMILAMENAGKLIMDEKLREQIKSSGIGTSATRAEIMKKLEKIGYIKTNVKTQILTPDVKGEIVYDIVKYSMPDMLNPELTASWEKGLNMVASGEITEEDFTKKLNKYVMLKVNKLKNERI